MVINGQPMGLSFLLIRYFPQNVGHRSSHISSPEKHLYLYTGDSSKLWNENSAGIFIALFLRHKSSFLDSNCYLFLRVFL